MKIAVIFLLLVSVTVSVEAVKQRKNTIVGSTGDCSYAVEDVESAYNAAETECGLVPTACNIHAWNFSTCLHAIEAAGSSLETLASSVSTAIGNCGRIAFCVEALLDVATGVSEAVAAEGEADAACAVPEPAEPAACAVAVAHFLDDVKDVGGDIKDAYDKCTSTPAPVTPPPTPIPVTPGPSGTCHGNQTRCPDGCCNNNASWHTSCCLAGSHLCCSTFYPICCDAHCCPEGNFCCPRSIGNAGCCPNSQPICCGDGCCSVDAGCENGQCGWVAKNGSKIFSRPTKSPFLKGTLGARVHYDP